jgi:hypothetical protein
MKMLTPLLHRRRKAAQALADTNDVLAGAGDAIERNRQIYGTRLLVRGILWMSLYGISRGLLALDIEPAAARVTVALLPTPFFVWWLWTWMEGVSRMDELERRIELEALAFAFPLAVILLMTLGLLDVAVELNPNDFSLRHVWAMMPVLYYLGLWRAKRRYA